ncbi:unnamed protein product, partial [Brassica rapa subsp. trilocularis]
QISSHLLLFFFFPDSLFSTLTSHSHISYISSLPSLSTPLSHLSQRLSHLTTTVSPPRLTTTASPSRLTTTASPPRLTTTVFPLVSPPPRWRSQGSRRLEEARFMAA